MAEGDLVIDRARTSWVFVSHSDDSRHLYDVIYAIAVLAARGVGHDRIHVCTDNRGAAGNLNPYGIQEINAIADFDAVLGRIDCDVVVLVVGGHGHQQGVGPPSAVLSPCGIAAKLKRLPGLKAGVVVLTQCFAGIFDLLEVGDDPPLVFLGATKLTSSLSSTFVLPAPVVQHDGTPGLSQWGANLFGAGFFRWLEQAVDVDGDGRLTVLDAFKFAGVLTNDMLVGAKSDLYVEAGNLAQQLRELQAAVAADAGKPITTPGELKAAMSKLMALSATRTKLSGHLELLHLHQEPWILHAKLARRIVVSL